MSDESLLNKYGQQRIADRQVDELVGLTRGLCADGILNQLEVEFLERWLAANAQIVNNPIIASLYARIRDVLSDGVADQIECRELMHALSEFSGNDFELGEALKSSSLPLCDPPPTLAFSGRSFCFTGTFNFGRRLLCEQAVVDRGGYCGSLTRKTDVLVVGIYATESWKHSSFGHKIMKASEMRDTGVPISIVSEEHWARHL